MLHLHSITVNRYLVAVHYAADAIAVSIGRRGHGIPAHFRSVPVQVLRCIQCALRDGDAEAALVNIVVIKIPDRAAAAVIFSGGHIVQVIAFAGLQQTAFPVCELIPIHIRLRARNHIRGVVEFRAFHYVRVRTIFCAKFKIQNLAIGNFQIPGQLPVNKDRVVGSRKTGRRHQRRFLLFLPRLIQETRIAGFVRKGGRNQLEHHRHRKQ